jgi:hypothetical protein
VYETSSGLPNGSVRSGNWDLKPGHCVHPSTDGTIKAVSFSHVSPIDPETADKDLPVLVVAIRGSASAVDHMVNANYQPQDTGDFIVSLAQFTNERPCWSFC